MSPTSTSMATEMLIICELWNRLMETNTSSSSKPFWQKTSSRTLHPSTWRKIRTIRLSFRSSAMNTSTVPLISSNPHTSTHRSSTTGSGVLTGFAGTHPGIGDTGPDGGTLIIAGHSMCTGIISGITTTITTIARSATPVILHPVTTRCTAILKQGVKTMPFAIPKGRSQAVTPARKTDEEMPSTALVTSSADVPMQVKAVPAKSLTKDEQTTAAVRMIVPIPA